MIDQEFHLEKPLRWGMVGGGRGSEIGYIHRNSARRDGLFSLVAAAFDVEPERGREFGANVGVPPDRCYKDYRELFAEEAKRPDGIEVVTIATPNFLHFEMCRAALNAGLHVVCEKPLCFTNAEADELLALAHKKQCMVGMTYGYTAFPMVHQARDMVKNGDIGDVRIINVQFAHGYLSEAIEEKSSNAKWRVTREFAGPAYVLGDVGTHALMLAETIVPGLKIERLMCTRQSFVKSRAPLEDNAIVIMHFAGGGVGNLWASSVNAGSMHQHKIRVVGSKASLEWWDEHPSQLRYEIQGKPAQILERGMPYLYMDDELVNSHRIGPGHPEGFFGSWATIYRRFGQAMDMINHGKTLQEVLDTLWVPSIADGVRGVRFIENCLRSSDDGCKWVDFM